MGNMREISVQECKAVFGGTDEPEEPGTIVTAPKSYQPSTAFYDSTWVFGSGGGFSLAGFAEQFHSRGLEIINGTHPITADDTNGDGIPDWQEGPGIDVIATVEQLYAADIAYTRAENDVGWAQVWLAALFGTRAATGGLSGGIQSGAGELTMQQLEGVLVQARAEYLYQQDRLDGVYDGYGPQDYTAITANPLQ